MNDRDDMFCLPLGSLRGRGAATIIGWGENMGEGYPIAALSPDQATAEINAIARTDFRLSWTKSARDRWTELSVCTGDIRHVLKNGEVVEPGKPTACLGYYKYVIECGAPNFSGNLRLLVIASSRENGIKVCDVLN